MKKVIFLDVDGTLVSASKGISDLVKKALIQARDNGHLVFVCTGRNKAGVRKLDLNLFDGIICSAGGYIEINNKVLYTKYWSEEDVKEVREVLDEMGALYNLEGTHTTYSHKDLNKFYLMSMLEKQVSNSELDRLAAQASEEFATVSLDRYDANPEPIHKMCFLVYNQKQKERLHELFNDKYHVVIHASKMDTIINGEFIDRSINKGLAIKKVIDYLGLSIEDTIGFGDSMNDYEMIKTCHLSVVMGNGNEELKKHADIICESVEEDGIYHEFKRLGLISE